MKVVKIHLTPEGHIERKQTHETPEMHNGHKEIQSTCKRDATRPQRDVKKLHRKANKNK